MKNLSLTQCVIAAFLMLLVGTAPLSAKTDNQHSVRPITQPGNKHHTRLLKRPHQPVKPPHSHRPPHHYRPHHHRPPYIVRPPRHHASHFYVRNAHWYPPYRGRYYYYHNDLVGIATFAVFAGITYAIVHDAYYQQRGNRYVYVESPPVGNYTIIDDIPNRSLSNTSELRQTDLPEVARSTNSANQAKQILSTKRTIKPSRYKLGQIIDTLPHTKKTVVVDGQSYFKYQDTWFIPLREQRKYKVVRSPLE